MGGVEGTLGRTGTTTSAIHKPLQKPSPAGRFQGLTEAIRKVSVAGGHTDNAFGRTVLFDCESTPSGWTGSTVSKVSDSTRRSNVYQTSGSSRHGSMWYLCGDGEAITGKRTFSVWLKAGGSSSSSFTVNFLTNNICRALTYVNTTGSPYYTGLDPEEGGTGDEEGYIQLGGTSQAFTSNWTRLERNIQADIDAMWPGETLVGVIGVSMYRGTSGTISMDDLAFSNSLTVEHDTLGPGSIGHILRHRTINTSTYAATDSWYHYDQVGSVMDESNSSGALSVQDWQDAYGNTQASFTTGLIGGTQSGFHHNTKGYLN